ncbi:hypothetical protein [Nucisporomicrobium flavum]|uniref:hypothetical protein n=1 Tax=Nucisporomicrobium flavum TaxID=2785915 RepID=UPI0018F3A7A8|nr:hypothetical protein [Nucisporomicrobium flavum]
MVQWRGKPLMAALVAASVLLAGGSVAAWLVTENPGGTTPKAPPAREPSVRTDGEAITVAVAPDRPLLVAVPGVGHLNAKSGSFTAAGRIVVRTLAAEQAPDSAVLLGGVGVDVSFDQTALRAPITVRFDDPATRNRVPRDAVPIVMHKPAGGDWEVKRLSRAADGVPYLSTDEFSPNLLGWIPIPDWVRELGDSLADMATQRTDARLCAGGAPDWSRVDRGTTQVHLCSITNRDRAELQVQSNRRFAQWVSVPDGADYVWVDQVPDVARTFIANATGHDRNQVLLTGGSWFTAGFRRPARSETKVFQAYLDPYSSAISVGFSILGLDPKNDLATVLPIVLECTAPILALKPSVSEENAVEFFRCFVEEALENLKNPDVAFAQAMDLYGEAAYAESSENGLAKAAHRLRFLGKIIGPVGVITSTFPQLPDLFSASGTDRPGQFTFELEAAPVKPTAEPNPPTTTDPPKAAPPRQEPAPHQKEQKPDPAPEPAPATWSETVGGATHTWTNPANAGGIEGATIASFTTVQVACRLTGFAVSNGNTNWYRIASPPWNHQFYASADAFYNNGATSGSLLRTPWFDPAVPPC